MDSFRGIREKICVIDFGSQYANLICRRIRDLGVYAELYPHDTRIEEINLGSVKGIVLSGGPSSVYEGGAPEADKRIFDLGIPILGLCYGMQLIAHLLGGKVEPAAVHEYGKERVSVIKDGGIFRGVPGEFNSWMSHGDIVTATPGGFEKIALTSNSEIAAFEGKRIYGLQFHPEVSHTEFGEKIISNFLEICGCSRSWRMESFVEDSIMQIREKVGKGRVLCAVSGGVDSTTLAILLREAIGDKLSCIFVDNGLLREGEFDGVSALLSSIGVNLIKVDASSRFLARLSGILDPEEKRKAIGDEFAKVFSEAAEANGPFQWLAQGTLYPDIIESSMAGKLAAVIKTHHNVGGMPGWMKMKILEPFNQLYKDEVRKIAGLLSVPDAMRLRHPFPGPGLAVRVIGEVTSEKLNICRKAGKIVEEELIAAGIYSDVWQAFAVVGDDRAVGVVGDKRRYGRIVTIRAVSSVDAMTADWVRLPYEVMGRMSGRITNEVDGVTMVTYAISSKPPATIEPQ